MCGAVVLDINETLMHNKYLDGGGYTEPCARPHLKEFIAELRRMDVHLALWCGAFTATRLKELMEFILPAAGLKKGDLVFSFPVLPSCTTRESYDRNKGKKIVIKPVSLVRQILRGSYEHIILFDNDIEKSLGLRQKPGSRWSNGPDEHVEITPFHTKNFTTDSELHPTNGDGARRLFDQINKLKQKL